MADSKRLNSILLTRARVVTPERVMLNADVFIENGRIAQIAEKKTVVRADAVYNLQGLTLYPGFIDAHNHGARGVDVNEADADGLRRVGEFLASEGVTAWLPTLVPAPPEDYARLVRAVAELMRAQDAAEANAPKDDKEKLENGNAASLDEKSASQSRIAARALGVHYEGPFVNAAQCGALRTRYFREFKSASDLEELPRVEHRHAVHLMTLAPEIEGGVELVRELVKRNWIVSIGHTRAELEILDEAAAAGARHLTHFMNAMTGLHHRSVGVVGWGLARDDVTCDVIADGVHVHPFVLRILLRAKTSERISLISDSVAPTGEGDGEFEMWGERIKVENRRTQNERGSIAGSVITMRDAVRQMLSLNCSPVEVARMASENLARLLGLEQELGSVSEGKRADLVALDENCAVRLTIIGGRVAFDARS